MIVYPILISELSAKYNKYITNVINIINYTISKTRVCVYMYVCTHIYIYIYIYKILFLVKFNLIPYSRIYIASLCKLYKRLEIMGKKKSYSPSYNVHHINFHIILYIPRVLV